MWPRFLVLCSLVWIVSSDPICGNKFTVETLKAPQQVRRNVLASQFVRNCFANITIRANLPNEDVFMAANLMCTLLAECNVGAGFENSKFIEQEIAILERRFTYQNFHRIQICVSRKFRERLAIYIINEDVFDEVQIFFRDQSDAMKEQLSQRMESYLREFHMCFQTSFQDQFRPSDEILLYGIVDYVFRLYV